MGAKLHDYLKPIGNTSIRSFARSDVINMKPEEIKEILHRVDEFNLLQIESPQHASFARREWF
jgi:hypothetical protein